MSAEVYVGESSMKENPKKKLNIMIRDGSISNSKLSDNSISTSKLIDSSVTNEKIADNAVTWQKLSKEIQDSIESGLGINLSTVLSKSFDNKILARNEVPVEFRTKGLIITYILNGKWRTEQYQGQGNPTDDWMDDNLWGLISGLGESFPISAKDVYDEFRGKTQKEVNDELSSHITMSDLRLDLKFDETTGDVYGETSDTSIFTNAEQEDNGDVVLTINN